MKLRMNLISVAMGCAVAASANATTTLDQWGTLATISAYDCVTEQCDTDADALSLAATLTVDPVDGAVGQLAATVATGTLPDPGSATGIATVSSGLGIPVLKAGAASASGHWIGGQALAVQAYTYTGAGETLSLDWNLTGNVTNPDGDGVTGLVVFAGFFRSDAAFAFPDASDPFTAYLLLTSLALASPADEFREFTAGGAVSETGTIDIAVSANDEFYLVMGLMAGAGGIDAVAESLGTLVGEFHGAPSLTPAFVAPVPVPPAAWLLASSCGALFAARRRRRE